ncbi:hypothetical protein [Endozoicomonas sp. ALC013]|uniref:hypothetical protein n=1 Tax=Endozoicomonas sp. ALC013 TaxID=3403076 RepID=UPI003BB531D5
MDSISLLETPMFKSALESNKKVTQPVRHNNKEISIGGVRHTSAHRAGYRSVEEIPLGERSISDPGPILVKCNNNVFWDLSRIDLKSLLLPGTFFTDQSKYIVGLQLARHIAEIFSYGTTLKEKDIEALNTFQQDQYKFCKLKLFDYPAQCVFFDLVGSKLRHLLSEELVAELDAKQLQDYLLVKEGFINLQLNTEQKANIEKQVRVSAIKDAETVCNAQKYRYSHPDGMKGEIFVKATAPKIRGVLSKVLGEVARGGLQLQDAPEFIGYVPAEIASSLIDKSGFTDSTWSGNFLHGRYSHVLALAFLSREAGLTETTLKAVVAHGLWDDLLDQSPYAKIDIQQLGDHEYLIHDRNPFTVPFSPFAFQEMLCTGQVSSTLRQVAKLIAGLSACEYAMLTTSFQEKLTPERLLTMAQNIQLLEHIIALEHHNDIFEIKQYFDMPTFGLVPLEILELSSGWTLGQFTAFRQSNELSAFAAKKAFKRGDKVVSVTTHYDSPLYRLFGYAPVCQQEIKKLKDFDIQPAFTSYVAWPAKNHPCNRLRLTQAPGNNV